jgi:hypothetical protein
VLLAEIGAAWVTAFSSEHFLFYGIGKERPGRVAIKPCAVRMGPA